MKKDKKFYKTVLLLIILFILLVFSSLALAFSLARVENNIFNFGKIHIEIGYYDDDGVSHYGEDGPVFKYIQGLNNDIVRPGEVISKHIFVENLGNLPTYYSIYFENIEDLEINGRSGLSDKINVKIIDDSDGQVLFGPIAVKEFTRDNIKSFGILDGYKSRVNLKLEIIYPEELPATLTQRGNVKFDICAEGVQVEHNPDKEFD